MSTVVSNKRRLRELITSNELITAPGVFDGVSAALVALGEFRAAYMTGAGVAAFGYGLPDIGLVTQTEMVDRVRLVTRILGSVPLIADADTGYGAPINVVRTVQQYEAAGVAAVQLEDQAFPKRCGHLPDKELVSIDEFTVKLTAALDARTDPDLVVIARTDARGPLGIDAAIDRANAYARAGADLIFVEAPQSLGEVEQIAQAVSAPLLINRVIGGLTPDIPTGHLAALGYRVAIHPSVPTRAAARAMAVAYSELGATFPADLVTSDGGPASLFRVVGLDEWSAIGERSQVPPGAVRAADR